MTEAQKRLALRLFEEGAIDLLRYHKLKLHEKHPNAPLSPIFFNLRTPDNPKQGPLNPDLVSNIGRQLYWLSCDTKQRYDYIAGVPRAGEPFGKVIHRICLLFGEKVELLYLVKDENGDGSRQISGLKDERKPEYGKIAIVVDDLITKADSKLEAIQVLEKEGLMVRDVVVLIDREQGGRQELEKAGYNLHSVFKISDLLFFYLLEKKINKEKHNEIMDYLKANS